MLAHLKTGFFQVSLRQNVPQECSLWVIAGRNGTVASPPFFSPPGEIFGSIWNPLPRFYTLIIGHLEQCGFYLFFTLIVGYLVIWSNVELFTLFFTLMQLPALESGCWWFRQDISWPGFPVFKRHTLVLHHHRWQTLWLKSCPFLITSHHHLLCVLQYKNNHQKGFLE